MVYNDLECDWQIISGIIDCRIAKHNLWSFIIICLCYNY